MKTLNQRVVVVKVDFRINMSKHEKRVGQSATVVAINPYGVPTTGNPTVYTVQFDDGEQLEFHEGELGFAG